MISKNNIDLIEDRDNIISTYKCIYDNMSNPVGVGFNLRLSRITKDMVRGKRSILLEKHHVESVWEKFTNCILNASYPRHMRKVINRPPIAIGGFELGRAEDNPHIHCVVDNVNGLYDHSFRWIVKECIIKTKIYTSWLGDNIHFEETIDRNYVSYFLKGSSFVSLYC